MERNNIFDVLFPPKKADKVKSVSDLTISFAEKLEEVGASKEAINKMISSVSLAQLVGDSPL